MRAYETHHLELKATKKTLIGTKSRNQLFDRLYNEDLRKTKNND